MKLHELIPSALAWLLSYFLNLDRLRRIIQGSSCGWCC